MRDSAYYTYSDIEYLKEYGEAFEFINHSFIVVNNKLPILGGIITEHFYDNQKIISGFGRPILFFEFKGVETSISFSARNFFIKKFLDIFDKKTSKVIYRDFLKGDKVNIFTRYLLDNKFKFRTSYLIKIDLTKELNFIKGDIRKNYRKYLTWSDKNQIIKIFDSKSCTKNIFDKFKNIHHTASGRITRNDESWKIQYKQILNDEAVLIGGKLGDDYVSFIFLTYNKYYAVYSVAASDRKLFDKPISHGLIWEGIKYLKEKGCHYMEMGEKSYSKDSKLAGIDNFKSGFGGEIYPKLDLE